MYKNRARRRRQVYRLIVSVQKKTEYNKSNTNDADSERILGELRFSQPSFLSISVPSVKCKKKKTNTNNENVFLWTDISLAIYSFISIVVRIGKKWLFLRIFVFQSTVWTIAAALKTNRWFICSNHHFHSNDKQHSKTLETIYNLFHFFIFVFINLRLLNNSLKARHHPPPLISIRIDALIYDLNWGFSLCQSKMETKHNLKWHLTVYLVIANKPEECN